VYGRGSDIAASPGSARRDGERPDYERPVSVASAAGTNLKKTVLELGGSDPFVVLDDANLGAAAETGAWARNLNGGQSCIAAKRFVVHTDVYDEFVDLLVEETEALTVGDPTDEETDVGPQAREDLMWDLHEQVERSIEAGATVLTGDEPMDREGAYYSPTILADVPAGCPADTEEVFGPVAAVYEVDDEADTVAKANATQFGLGASVWTGERDRGRRLARRIDAGCTYVNQLVKSEPRVPLAASSSPATVENSPKPGSKSSSTGRRSGWSEPHRERATTDSRRHGAQATRRLHSHQESWCITDSSRPS
jgi:succinate-semialdehyde dehydrogenase/glutarate-semialdehyde dehydrogenase